MKKDLRLLAVLQSQENANELKSAMSNFDGLDWEIKVSDFQNVAADLMNSHVPNVLLAEISFDRPGDLTELSRIVRESCQDTAVIATAEQADFEGIRRLMRMGVADFIPQPISQLDVRNALNVAVSKLSQPISAEGKVVTFLRSCGGAGATTLALQTALSLRHLNRKDPKRVCLIDFDLQFGNLGLSLDLEENVGIQQILESPSRLDGDFFLGSILRHPSGIDVLAAPDRIIPLSAVTGDTAFEILDMARSIYDYVVVDMPLAWTDWTSYVVAASHVIGLVTDINVTAVQRCRRLLNLMAEQELDDIPLTIIANRFKGGFSAKSRKRQAEKALGAPITHFIRSDVEVACAARDRGVILSEIKKKSVIEKDVDAFVSHIHDKFLTGHKVSVRSAA
jgi:pilus assembly protein CpaE